MRGTPWRVLPALLALVAGSGCDLVAPERAINEDAAPPEAVPFEALRRDLAYAGPLTLTLPRADVPPEATLATLYVDGAPVADCDRPPCDVPLDTAQFPDGPHALAVTYLPPGGVDPAVGLGALLGLSRVILHDTLVFDQSPPEPVAVTEATWTEAGVRLRWESPGDANRNARAYRLLPERSGQQVGDAVRIEAPASTALDAQFPFRMGDFVTYRVSVTNGVPDGSFGGTVRATSEPVVVEASPRIGATRFCGEPLDDPVIRGVDVAGVTGADRLLGLCATPEGASIRPFTFSSRTIGAAVAVAPPPGVSPFGLDLAHDPSGRFALFASTSGVPTRVFAATLDPVALAVGPWVELEAPNVWGLEPAGAAVGPDGRYFVSGYYERVHVYDPATGAHLQTLLPQRQPGTQRTVSRRVGQSGLFVTREPEYYRIDMAADPAVVTAEGAFGFGEHFEFATDATGRVYRVRYPEGLRVEVLDPATLAVERSFAVDALTDIVRLRGGVDGVFAFVPIDVAAYEVVHLAPDGTVLGRRPAVELDAFHPAPTRGDVFFTNGGRAPSVDTVSR